MVEVDRKEERRVVARLFVFVFGAVCLVYAWVVSFVSYGSVVWLSWLAAACVGWAVFPVWRGDLVELVDDWQARRFVASLSVEDAQEFLQWRLAMPEEMRFGMLLDEWLNERWEREFLGEVPEENRGV